MRESSTDPFPPQMRAMIAVVWDVPPKISEALEVQFDQWAPVPVPSTDLDKYLWFRTRLE
jgi:hypothetical protein